MKVFPIIRNVLEEEIDEIVDDLDSEQNDLVLAAVGKVRAALKKLSISYSNTYENELPDFSRPEIRHAYIFRYTTAHADMICQAINKSSDLTALFNEKKVIVSCIGGGPGSDMLGIVKYILRKPDKPNLKIYLIDKEIAWSNSWGSVDEYVSSEFMCSKDFLTVDVTDPSTYIKLPKHARADLFTFSFFLSEIYRHQEKSNLYFDWLIDKAKPGALLLFIDFRHDNNKSWISEIAERNDLEVLEEEDERAFRLDFSEEKAELQDLMELYGEGPRLKGDIVFLLLQKH